MLIALFMATFLFLDPLAAGGRRRIVVQFRHSEGMAPLKVGSPVFLSGALEIGSVVAVFPETVLLAPTDGGEPVEDLVITVRADMDRKIALYGDCQITTDQPAVGGVGSLVILNVGTPGTPLHASNPIVGLRPQSFAATISTLSQRLLGPGGLVDKIDGLLDPNGEQSLAAKVLTSLSDINALTGELRMQLSVAEQASLMSKLHGIIDDVNSVTVSMRDQLGVETPESLVAKLHQVLDHVTVGLEEMTGLLRDNRPTLTRTLNNVERLTGRLDAELLAALLAELDRDDPNSMLGKVHVAMNLVNSSLADVETMAATGRELLVLGRPLIDRAISNVKDMSENLRLLSQEVRLAPWRLMYEPDTAELREMTIFEAARTFAEAATFLDDAAARLDAAVAASAGTAAGEEGIDMRGVRDSVRAAFERFSKAEEFLYQKMK